MNCITCNKYLKKGHGINTYYYRGVWHYYCSLCLKIRNHNWRVSRRNKEYLSTTSIFTLGLTGLVWWMAESQIKTKILFWLPYVLAVIPFIIALFIWFKWIQPYLERLNSEEWEPLWKEQEKINELEDYVKSLNKSNEPCLCAKCLVEEWKRKK